MSQKQTHKGKGERVSRILEMLHNGQPRDKIAEQFGYSTWKSLDIYMRRHGFTWDSLHHIYTNAATSNPVSKTQLTTQNTIAEHNLTDVNPEEIIRLFSIGILDAREIAKRTGFSGHKEMASYMLRRGYVWSSSSVNYINSNPSVAKPSSDCSIQAEGSLQDGDNIHMGQPLSEVLAIDKYKSLLEFLWQSRDKLVKIIEALNDGDKIQVYTIPGKAKTKSIFLSDGLSELMLNFCQKNSVSQRQGYEAALIEYLMKYGYQDNIEQLLSTKETIETSHVV